MSAFVCHVPRAVGGGGGGCSTYSATFVFCAWWGGHVPCDPPGEVWLVRRTDALANMVKCVGCVGYE